MTKISGPNHVGWGQGIRSTTEGVCVHVLALTVERRGDQECDKSEVFAQILTHIIVRKLTTRNGNEYARMRYM